MKFFEAFANIFRIPEEEVELSGKRLENRHESEPYREAAE